MKIIQKVFLVMSFFLGSFGFFLGGGLSPFFSSSIAYAAKKTVVSKKKLKKRKQQKKRKIRKKHFRRRLPKAQGSRAPSRFEPNTILESIYQRHGKPLPVDPD